MMKKCSLLFVFFLALAIVAPTQSYAQFGSGPGDECWGPNCPPGGPNVPPPREPNDFTGLFYDSVPDVIRAVPEGTPPKPFNPIPGGAQDGVKYQWHDGEKTVRLYIHDRNPGAPAGSHSNPDPGTINDGWIVRVKRGSKFIDIDGNWQPGGVCDPNSSNYNEEACNNTHIPILPPIGPLPGGGNSSGN